MRYQNHRSYQTDLCSYIPIALCMRQIITFVKTTLTALWPWIVCLWFRFCSVTSPERDPQVDNIRRKQERPKKPRHEFRISKQYLWKNYIPRRPPNQPFSLEGSTQPRRQHGVVVKSCSEANASPRQLQHISKIMLTPLERMASYCLQITSNVASLGTMNILTTPSRHFRTCNWIPPLMKPSWQLIWTAVVAHQHTARGCGATQ